jgi:PPP family 3-phenylpropionic acid transporter
VLKTQYFFYFGVLGVFLPFFNLYCHHLGFSGFQIGALSAVRSAAMVLFPVVWGALADRYHARRPIYLACNIVSTALWAGFLFSTDFTVMLAMTLAYGIFFAPIISFLEAFTMDALAGEKKSYGRIRAWGSISFITTVVLLGKALDRYPSDMVLFLILTGAAIQALAATQIPAPLSATAASRQEVGAGSLWTTRTLLFLLAAFLMLVSHGAYYGFFSIHLEALGCGKTFIGFSWALASSAEIIVMLFSNTLFQRFGLSSVLLFSFVVAAGRWLTLALVEAPWLILLSQVLHAVTYGTFHMASILYIDRLSPGWGKTRGQAVNNAVTYGLGLMVGFLASGLGYEPIGAQGLFGVSAIIALAGAVLMRILQAAEQ